MSAPVPPVPPVPPAPPVESRWHYRRSLASRVTLLTTIAVGLAVAFVALGAYITARAQLQEQLDDSLIERARATARADSMSSSVLVVGDDLIIYILVAGSGPPEPDDTQLPIGRPEFEVATGARDESLRTLMDSAGEEYRVVAVPMQVDGRALIFAQSLEQQEKVLNRVGWVCLLFGLIGVLGAGIAGWAVARNGLRPVRRLTASVEQIAKTEDLTANLPIEGDDEMARLAAAFNQMLASLGASRDRQRRLVTDAGHELRTPLTSLRTNVDLLTQVAQADPDDQGGSQFPAAARDELLDDIRAQIDELTTLIGDLTELARDEPLAPVVGQVDLSAVVEDSVARVRRRAPQTTFEVDAAPWHVVGESGSLERAVTNLLDNAAKWTPPGGLVRVWLADGVLTVDDQGPGIAEADRDHVFDRFWRAEESRSMPGSGLGLSIVRQVVERHGGRVIAEAAPGGGARLRMWLPGQPEAGGE